MKIGSAETATYESEISPIPDDGIYYGDITLFKFGTAVVDLKIRTAKTISGMGTAPYNDFKINDCVSYGTVDDLVAWTSTGPTYISGRTYNFNVSPGRYIYKYFEPTLSLYGIQTLNLDVTTGITGSSLLFFGMGTRLYSNYLDIEYLFPMDVATVGSNSFAFDLSIIEPKHYQQIRYLYLIQGTTGLAFTATFTKIVTDKTVGFFQWQARVRDVTQKYDFALGDFVLKKV
jgi:hypothetical protein